MPSFPLTHLLFSLKCPLSHHLTVVCMCVCISHLWGFWRGSPGQNTKLLKSLETIAAVWMSATQAAVISSLLRSPPPKVFWKQRVSWCLALIKLKKIILKFLAEAVGFLLFVTSFHPFFFCCRALFTSFLLVSCWHALLFCFPDPRQIHSVDLWRSFGISAFIKPRGCPPTPSLIINETNKKKTQEIKPPQDFIEEISAGDTISPHSSDKRLSVLSAVLYRMYGGQIFLL